MNVLTTDPQDELLTEVDDNNKVIGSIDRKTGHLSPDKIYRTIYIVVKNKNGKILIQKRSKTKDLYPNCWDLSVGGHVNFGSSYEETAVKELGEELGIKATQEEFTFLGEVLVKLPSSNEFFHIFEYKLKDNDVVKEEKDEISSTKYLTIEEIKKSMKNKLLRWYPRPLQVVQALF